MFQKYKYVLAVYREGSFTGAAQKLFISQPSLSVAIRSVEREIGAPLFERSGSGAVPTEMGEAYIAAARKMLAAEAEFEKQRLDIQGLQTGKLVVGGSNYLVSYVLPGIITEFRSRHPHVEITLAEANSGRLRELLHGEEVDLVIDNFEEGSDLYEKYPLADEQILLCVPGDRPVHRGLEPFRIRPEEIFDGSIDLGAVPAVDMAHFGAEPFVLLKEGNDMHRRATAIFEECSMLPQVIFRVDQLNIACALAESGMGACFVTDTLFRYRRHTENVVLYKPATAWAVRELYVAHKKRRYRTKAMAELIKIAQERIKNPRVP